jgi:hypothetical protein
MPKMADDDAARIFAEQTSNNTNGAKPPPRFKILTTAQFVSTFIPPDYLIDGILMRGFVYALTGPTAHAKSAIALLVAELVGSTNKNAMFGPHHVDKGRVLYFVGENPLDICMRVIGSHSQRFDDPDDDQVFWITGRIDFDAAFDEIANGVAAIGGIALVIVDTSAAYFLGEDENSNPQMGAHARKLRRLTTLPGNPCVLVLCHPIKNAQEPAQLLPRGGGAFLAEMDGNLTAWKTDQLVQLHFTKLRGPGFEPMMFRLERVETTKLRDSKGRVLPTVRAIAASEESERAQQSGQTADENQLLSILGTAVDQSYPTLARSLGWLNEANEPSRMRVKRGMDRLKAAKPPLIRQNRDRWELTDKGREVAVRISADQYRAADREAQAQMAFEKSP